MQAQAPDFSIGSVFSDISTSLYKPTDLSNSLTLSETVLGVTAVGHDVTLSSECTSDLFSSLSHSQTELSVRLDKLKREGKREQIGWELERKELLHKLQILTLELSQQKLRVETEEAHRLTDIEELEESLQAARAHIRMLQVCLLY
ncbi:hypothetical protein LOD99_10472 [Oopsacas minuta]|uniref:Uncharacterized protein n=1 Tax=Oopsacas minuta TaxID=111878 RepID=A0AAV7KGF1_9METZ|nr:hypothetical protein LOD99_10472 [Oopsacas minuta]